MSRLLIALLVFAPISAHAQPQKITDAQITVMIEKQRRMVALDADGCERYIEEDIIVVCGRDEEKERQRTGDKTINNDRIRVGEGYDATKAARCLPGDKNCRIALPASWGAKFGKVPPIAIPLEEILRGLPEPNMIFPEGTTAPPS